MRHYNGISTESYRYLNSVRKAQAQPDTLATLILRHHLCNLTVGMSSTHYAIRCVKHSETITTVKR